MKSEVYESAHLPEHFVIFQPKDIVSGDFYWVHEKDNYLYVAVADCTGHGVPGAFLTMLGSSFLNEISAGENFMKPAKILDRLREKIVKELSQKGLRGGSRDGMDISLIRIDLKNFQIMWAGANNPLWFKRNDSDELEEIAANKEPIGHSTNMNPYTNHEMQLAKGDTFYLFSDGYVDQFGGPEGKKFKKRAFRSMILAIQDKPMEEQKKFIEDSFDKWKGMLEQIDDVCVIGMKL